MKALCAAILLTLAATASHAVAGIQCSYCQIYLQQCCFNPAGCGVLNVDAAVQAGLKAQKGFEFANSVKSKMNALKDPVGILGLSDIFEELTTIEITFERAHNPCLKQEKVEKQAKAVNQLRNAAGIASQHQAEQLNQDIFQTALENNHDRLQQVRNYLKDLTAYKERVDKRMKKAKTARDYLQAAANYLMLEGSYVAASTSALAIQLDLQAASQLSLDPDVIRAAAGKPPALDKVQKENQARQDG